MEKVTMKQILSLPNLLSYFRIALIPVFLHYFVYGHEQRDYYMAALVIVVSSITDFLDGFIARRFNLITDVGKIVDPIADKLTQITIGIVLVFTYPLMWLVTMVMILKDAMLGLGSFYLFRKGTKAKGASWYGKVSTAFFDVVVILLIAFRNPGSTVLNILIIISGILMLFSFVLYGQEICMMIRKRVWLEN